MRSLNDSNAYSGILLIIVGGTLMLGMWMVAFQLGEYPDQLREFSEFTFWQPPQVAESDPGGFLNPITYIINLIGSAIGIVVNTLFGMAQIAINTLQFIIVIFSMDISYLGSEVSGIYGLFFKVGVWLMLMLGFIGIARGGT